MTRLLLLVYCTNYHQVAEIVMIYQHLSIIEARERELTDNKTTKGNYHVRIYLKDVFGFAEIQ